jgi:hypothetical protein
MKKYARGALVSVTSGLTLQEHTVVHQPNYIDKEGMALLGITEADLDPLSLHHFMKFTKTLDEANLLYQKHMERRARLLEELNAKRKELLHQQPKNLKPSAEVLHEQHMIAMLTQQAANMEQEGSAILRRLAIQQLRTVLEFQKKVAESARTDAKAGAQSEKILSARRAAQEAVESRQMSPRRVDPGQPPPVKDVAAHLQRARTVRESQMKQLEEKAARVQEQVAKAHQTADEILNETVARAQQKVVVTEKRLALVSPRLAEKQQQLLQRASERDALAKEKQNRIKETEEERIARQTQQLQVKEQRAQTLLQKLAEENRLKLAKEKEEFERRNRAAEQIFEQLKQQKAETARAIAQHRVEVEQRLVVQEHEKRAKVFEKATANAEKGEEVRRIGRMRVTEAQKELREKTEAAAGYAANLQGEKVRAIQAKERARNSFAQKKAALEEISARMPHLSEAELVEELKSALGIDETEANGIIQAAKQPRGPHSE